MDNLKQPHLKIKKENAQTFIQYIKKKLKGSSILTDKFEVVRQGNFVLFPLNKEIPDYKTIKTQLVEDLNCKIINIKAKKNLDYTPRSLEDALDGKIPASLIDLVPKSYDIIGNIAIVELDQFNAHNNVENIKKKIAKAIIAVNHNIETVYEKGSEIEGKFRLRKLNFIAGRKDPITIHKENNCAFKLNIQETFFSPRLNYERERVSTADIELGECIADLFSGVGPFSIQIAHLNKVKIFAFDVNPKAIKYLRENITLNKLKGSITPFNTNIKELLKSSDSVGNTLKHTIDRIIMNLPSRSLDFVDVIAHLAKKDGAVIHNYQFCAKPQPIQKAIKNLKKSLNSNDLRLQKIRQARIVKSYSPKEDMVGIDALIKNIESI